MNCGNFHVTMIAPETAWLSAAQGEEYSAPQRPAGQGLRSVAARLRRRQLTLAGPVREIVLRSEVAAALRELRLLDADCERLVFAIRARNDRAALAATGNDLDELIGFVAAEANHEPSRRRRQRLHTAFDALSNAAPATGS
jgi:hypothetical protein